MIEARDASYAAGSPNLALLGGLAQEALHLKRPLSAQHVIDGSTQLGGEDREALALAVLRLKSPRHLLAFLAVAHKEGGSFGEGPLEMRVADLRSPGSEPLAGRAVLALDQPGIGEEVLDSGEAVDVVDLVEDRHGEDLADAGDGPEAVEGIGIVLLGLVDQMELELANDVVLVLDQEEVDLHALPGIGFGKGIGDAHAVRLVGDHGPGLGEVVLVVGVLDMGEELGPLADQVEPPSKQIPSGAHLGGIDVGERDVPTPQQGRDLEGVDLVVLGLTAVYGLHIEGMAQDEHNPFSLTEIGESVPGEDTLGADDEVLAVGLDGGQEGLGPALDVLVKDDLAVPIEDVEVEGLGVEIDAAVVAMGLVVESYGPLLRVGC